MDEVYRRGGREIQLIGGEPLLHPDFADFLRFAHQIGMERIDVFTNATLVDDSIAALLHENQANVCVSLYGPSAEIHDKVTQRAGSFAKTKGRLSLLKRYGIPVKVSVIITEGKILGKRCALYGVVPEKGTQKRDNPAESRIIIT